MKLPRDLSGADPLKIGTLAAILNDVAGHLKITREQLQERLF